MSRFGLDIPMGTGASRKGGRASKLYTSQQLEFLKGNLPAYLKLGNARKSIQREHFLKRMAEEFEQRFRDEDNTSPVFQDMSQYKEVRHPTLFQR